MKLLLQALLVSTLFLLLTAVERGPVPQDDGKTTGAMDSPGENNKMSEIRIDQPTLAVEISADEKAIQVKYRVKNTTSGPIYLFNVIWDFDRTGNYVMAPQPAYVSLNQKHVLNIGKIVLPLPRSKKVEFRIIPFATKVDAGKEFEETFELSIPVEEYNSYFEREPDSTTEPQKSRAAAFVLHFVRHSDALGVKPAPIGSSLLLSPPNLKGALETLSSPPRAIEVVVNKRTDPFESFGE
jgi:hypothetical protein